MTLGDRIKQLRKDMGLNQIDFGKRIGVSGATISTSESGKTTPDEQTIRAICSEFGINRDWLVDGVGDMRPSPVLIPSSIHNLRDYPRALELLSAMTPSEWQALENLLDRVFSQRKPQ